MSHILRWVDVVAAVLLPWAGLWRPTWAPVVAAAWVVLQPLGRRHRGRDPLPGAAVAASAVCALVAFAGLRVAVSWLALAGAVAAVAWAGWGRELARPDAADLVGVVGWGAALALRPALFDATWGGWLAPAVLLLAVRSAVVAARRPSRRHEPGPPSREVRGTLSLHQLVLGDADSVPRTVPLELELRAGDSLAVVCDASADGQPLADVLAARRPPLSGEVAVDGAPVTAGERVCAVVGPGELFVAGDLEDNLSVLCDEPPDHGALSAVAEACNLDEVMAVLDGGTLAPSGAPLGMYHRLLVLAARVAPSPYRMLVVVDPMPWTDAVRREIWRGAVVRASVGRTAVWITADRELASRADRMVALRHGSLRAVERGGEDG